MKKLLFYSILIAIVVISTLLTISIVVPLKDAPEYSDEKLRELALDKGLEPVPASFEKLLELFDTDANPMTPQKIALGSLLFLILTSQKTKRQAVRLVTLLIKILKIKALF